MGGDGGIFNLGRIGRLESYTCNNYDYIDLVK